MKRSGRRSSASSAISTRFSRPIPSGSFVSVVVLTLGPGAISLDNLLRRGRPDRAE